MPVHDWTRVSAGVFHDFHQRWIGALRDVLNEKLLPRDYYALAEQVTEGPIPDVITLEHCDQDEDLRQAASSAESPPCGVPIAIADHPPQVKYCLEGRQDLYAAKASHVAIYHVSGDRVVGYIEIVSPGNKHSEWASRAFLSKLAEAMRRGCHLLVIDVHPPSPRDPRGLHARFWNEMFGEANSPGVTAEQPLSATAYYSDLLPRAYFEPFAVHDCLIDMPVFLSLEEYVSVSLESTYQDAWRGVPNRWKDVVTE